MKLESKLKLIHGLFLAAPIFVVAVIGVMLLDGWINSPAAHQVRTAKTPSVQKQEKPEAKQEAPPATAPATQYADVNEYFSAGNPYPLSHRFGLPRYEREVSRSLKKKIKERDGNCCVVCGSTEDLEVEHRRALMNNGDNSESNLSTLCVPCHDKKTRLDWEVKKRRRKNGEGH